MLDHIYITHFKYNYSNLKEKKIKIPVDNKKTPADYKN